VLRESFEVAQGRRFGAGCHLHQSLVELYRAAPSSGATDARPHRDRAIRWNLDMILRMRRSGKIPAFVAIPAVLVVVGAVAGAAQTAADSALPPRSRATLALQAALDRAGYSPGLVDGVHGRKTDIALRSFRAARGLRGGDGPLDAETAAALSVSEDQAVSEYLVTAADLSDVGAVPEDWNRKAALDRLRYESLAALLAERGHCKIATVEWLNPGVDFRGLKAGRSVVLPTVSPAAPIVGAASIEVDLDEKLVRVLDARGRLLALFHCSIAAMAEKRPSGETHVEAICENPDYLFRPEMWPEVKNVRKPLRIPPGPRNPVGLCWIDLGLPGYGIHGTPKPELIGKTGSHGCIRLANWDAVRLGKAATVGMPVVFLQK